jgi:hypothetical protein
MKRSILDFLDRVGSTFVQSLAGSVVALGTVTTLTGINWKADLTAAGTAAVLAAAKALSVQAANRASLANGGKVDVDAVVKAMGDKLKG